MTIDKKVDFETCRFRQQGVVVRSRGQLPFSISSVLGVKSFLRLSPSKRRFVTSISGAKVFF